MTTKEMALSQVRQGMTATVHRLLSNGSIRRRLLDMGLIEGTEIRCLYSSPSGDPTAFLVRGTVVALRRRDADRIRVFAALKEPAGNAENGNHGRNDINKEGEMHGTYIRFNRAQRSGQRPGH